MKIINLDDSNGDVAEFPYDDRTMPFVYHVAAAYAEDAGLPEGTYHFLLINQSDYFWKVDVTVTAPPNPTRVYTGTLAY